MLDAWKLPRTVLLKKTEMGVLNEQIVFTSYGNPLLLNRNIDFNISHSEKIVSCVTGDESVGVDVEKISSIDHSRIFWRRM